MSRLTSSSWLRRTGSTAFNVLFPIAAIRQTADLARREADRTRANLALVRDLGKSARQAITAPAGEAPDDAFEAAMARRRSDAMSPPELRVHFLRRKRIAIFAAVFFLGCAVLQVLFGAWSHSARAIALGIVCGLSGQPMFFVIALGAQLRIWQLDTHRLSALERGGLKDFMRDCPLWWRATINPELSWPFKGEA